MSPAAAAPAAVPHKGLITVSIMLATIMQALDTTIANVALPSMQGSLGAAQDQITWVLTSYIVAAAIMTPLTGWLSDRCGLRQVFIASVAGFIVTSMACGLATSLGQMVAFRTLQGLGGAALVPLSQTVLLNINSREEHGRAMAIWGAGIMVGPIVGPSLGGWLTDSFGWRYVFYVNLPVGLLALGGMLAFLPRSTPAPAASTSSASPCSRSPSAPSSCSSTVVNRSTGSPPPRAGSRSGSPPPASGPSCSISPDGRIPSSTPTSSATPTS